MTPNRGKAGGCEHEWAMSVIPGSCYTPSFTYRVCKKCGIDKERITP
jgi:hypothetical protein